ncbi:MAG TPA: TMEM175 family protein [Vicinamibacterales bacterium]|jgi:uncharacterized membrane protein|nr:TMEM175 family protein [Vicinamibacterales bacterium]
MGTGRLEAFSDGVLAIIITIMVLDLRVPEGESGLASLHAVWPKFVSYVLSFIYIGIYWNNHHHLLHVTRRVNGTVLWSNLHLLFWLSLVPFATSWVGENHFAPAPMALYGFILLMAAIAYYVLQMTLKSADGPQSLLASALGTDLKGKMSPVLYLIAIAVAFVRPAISGAIYVLVALIWLVPDRRIERVIAARHESLG